MPDGKLLIKVVMPHHKALQPTANPLRGLPAAQLDRQAAADSWAVSNIAMLM